MVLRLLLVICAVMLAVNADEAAPTTNPDCFFNVKYESREEIMSMDHSKCIDHCNSAGTTYAVLNNGSYCACVNKLETEKITIGENGDGEVTTVNADTCLACRIPCVGNEAETCGGSTCSTVIKLKQSAAAPTTNPDCFFHVKYESREEIKNMDQSKCIDHCNSVGTKYAVLNNGSYCACVNKLETEQKTIAENGDEEVKTVNANTCSACHIPCVGNEDEKCGGITCSTVIKLKQYAAGFVNIGCFSDVKTEGSQGRNSHSECTKYCNSTKSVYAVLTQGSYCSCVNLLISEIEVHQKAISMTAQRCSSCDAPCTGNTDEMCGNSDSCSTVIKLKQLYLGCYSIPASEKWSTSPICIHYCNTNHKSKFAMIKPGFGCMCVNELPSTPEEEDSKCNNSCFLYAGETCGGADADNVYASIYSTA